MYSQRQRLKELVEEAQQGTISLELVKILQQIARGLHGRFHFKIPPVEDFQQEIFLLFLAKVHNIDTSRNVFSYISTMALNYFRQQYRLTHNYQKMLEGYEKEQRKRKPKL